MPKRPSNTKPATPKRPAKAVEATSASRARNVMQAARAGLTSADVAFIASVRARFIPAHEKTHWLVLEGVQRTFHCTVAERDRLDQLAADRGIKLADLLRVEAL